MRFEVTAGGPRADTYEIVRDSSRNFRRLDDLGFLDGKARNQLENLKNRGINLSTTSGDVLFDANQCYQIESRIERVESDLDAIERRLMSDLNDRKSQITITIRNTGHVHVNRLSSRGDVFFKSKRFE